MNDEFYIGWQKKAAPDIARTTGFAAAALLAAALLAPVVLALSQRMIGTSVFEYGIHKEVSGIFQAQPCPLLLVPRPGIAEGQPAYSTYYLVARWKFGLPTQALAAFDGKWVTLKGTLIYRGNQTMIETSPDWIKADEKSAAQPIPQTISLGRQTLTGEIVDSKCFLGVMNPGQFAPHRACAIRCISGGIPPIFVVPQTNGAAIYLLLVSAEGKAVNQQILDFVAEPVEITGDVERQGDVLILRADPSTCRRVNP